MELEKTIKKSLKSLHLSAKILIVGAILSAVFFLLLSELFKTYKSDISILVNLKSEIAVKQEQNILNSIMELPTTLSFYDRMLEANSDIRDVSEGLSSRQRKDVWNDMISLQRSNDEALVFKLSISAKQENDAKQLSSKAARTLFDTIALYYDVKNDVDLRIIDGPITKSYVRGWYVLLFLSIIGGFALALVLDSFSAIGKQHLKRGGDIFMKNSFFDFKKKTDIPAEKEIESLHSLYEQQVPPFIFKEEKKYHVPSESEQKKEEIDFEEPSREDLRFQEMKKITKKMEPGKYPNFPEMPVMEKKKASAPDNLPIADESFFQEYGIDQEPVEKEKDIDTREEKQEKDSQEPTPEELKKRLNQLLKGEL
ncbi:MAG: hypothetical protein ACD_9C00189G0003 [uncultured bacterium]|nr:MAG: hypothetical protein ACD_9C00189G0003 [uncultured bacterium]